MNISEEAVEAAAKVLADLNSRPKEWQFHLSDAKAALAAAAPYLMAAAYEHGFSDASGDIPWTNPYRSSGAGE